MADHTSPFLAINLALYNSIEQLGIGNEAAIIISTVSVLGCARKLRLEI